MTPATGGDRGSLKVCLTVQQSEGPGGPRTLVVRTKRFSSSSAARYFLQWLNHEYAMMLFTPAQGAPEKQVLDS